MTTSNDNSNASAAQTTSITELMTDAGAHHFAREMSDLLESDGPAGAIIKDLEAAIGPRLKCAAAMVSAIGAGDSFESGHVDMYQANAHVLRREAAGLLEVAATMMEYAGRLDEMAHTAEQLGFAAMLDNAGNAVPSGVRS